MRGQGPTYPCGHPRTAENTRATKRCCKTCHRAGEAARKRRQAEAEGRTLRTVDPLTFPCGHPREAGNVRTGNKGCKACHSEREATRRAADPEATRARNREYSRKRNGPERNAYRRDWYARNIEHARAYNRRAQRLRKHAKGDVDTIEYIDMLAGDPCVYCGGPADTVEHIVAVTRGGESHWTNYAAACARCNTSKMAAPLLTFLLRRAG